jgi:hypothetical protein
VRDAVAAYFEEEADAEDTIEDTPDEVILASFRRAWREAMSGQTIPADEVMERLRAKRAKNAICEGKKNKGGMDFVEPAPLVGFDLISRGF